MCTTQTLRALLKHCVHYSNTACTTQTLRAHTHHIHRGIISRIIFILAHLVEEVIRVIVKQILYSILLG